jgi:hypothetical protein
MSGVDMGEVEAEEVALEPDDGVVESAGTPPPPETQSMSAEEFALRAAAKVEEQLQDRGILVPPGHEGDPEPLDDVDAPEEPVAPPPPVEAEAEEPDEEPAPQDDDFFLNVGSSRYKNAEEAARGVREKDLEIERLRLELEQRRRLEEEVRQQAEEPQQIDRNAWMDWADEAVAAGAGPNGAMEALKTGGMEGYDVYMERWLADDDQRGIALAFNNRVMLQMAEQRAQAAVQPMAQDRASAVERAEAVAAKEQLAQTYPDFKEHQEEMDRLVASGELDPGTAAWLRSTALSGFEGKLRAWEYLYLQASRTKAPTKQKATTTERKRRQSSADAAKVAASVSSAEGSAARTPLPAAEQSVLERRNALRKEWNLPLLEE